MIDRELLNRFKVEAIAALAVVAAKHGVVAKFGRGTFSPEVATLKLELGYIADNGIASSREALDFKSMAWQFGLAASDLGKKIALSNGVEYRIVGLKPRSKTRPVLGEREDGKVFKLTVDAVKVGLEGLSLKVV